MESNWEKTFIAMGDIDSYRCHIYNEISEKVKELFQEVDSRGLQETITKVSELVSFIPYFDYQFYMLSYRINQIYEIRKSINQSIPIEYANLKKIRYTVEDFCIFENGLLRAIKEYMFALFDLGDMQEDKFRKLFEYKKLIAICFHHMKIVIQNINDRYDLLLPK